MSSSNVIDEGSTRTSTKVEETPGRESGARAPGQGRSRENTRERLLEAAVDVFVSKGLKRVTVDDLTRAAGFTRGAFYSNFDSVDEVFHAVFRARAELLLRRARAAIDSAETVDVEFVIDLMRAMSADREWLVLHSEVTLLALRDDEARSLLIDVSGQLRAELGDVIAAVMERLGRRPSVPMEQLALVATGLQSQLATARAVGQIEADPEGSRSTIDVSEELFRRVLTVLITELSEPVSAELSEPVGTELSEPVG